MFMLHVDDILFCGQTDWWGNSVVPGFRRCFAVGCGGLGGVGSSVHSQFCEAQNHEDRERPFSHPWHQR